MDLTAATGKPIAVGFAGGDEARRLESLPDDQVVELGLAAMRAVVGSDLPTPEAPVVTHWAADPVRARVVLVRWPSGRRATIATRSPSPSATRLFLAGEATNRQHPSTVHGAWESGLAAADRVIAAR